MAINNEGFRVLDEFVCQAIAAPGVRAFAAGGSARGMNQGVASVQEVVVLAGSAEGMETVRERKEVLSRFLINCIFQARALELGKRLPIVPSDLDFGEHGSEAMVRAVSRYLMIRDANYLSPSTFRRAFFIDLAIFMVDVARPSSVFCAEARATAVEVAERLLQFEGWSAAPGTLSEWRKQTLAIDPAGIQAAKEYHGLLKRYWAWTGATTAIGSLQAPINIDVVVPEAILINLARRCA